MKDKFDNESRSSMKTFGFETKNTALEKQISETTSEKKTNETPVEENAEPMDETKLKSLQKQVENLREKRNCKICLENEASIVFLPCGHLCSCANCAPALKVSFASDCASLKNITSILRIVLCAGLLSKG